MVEGVVRGVFAGSNGDSITDCFCLKVLAATSRGERCCSE